MVITFAQYSILTATYRGATFHEVANKTTFDQMMVNYYMTGLLNIGLIKMVSKADSEAISYELTDLGISYIEDYERANPELVIKRTVYDIRTN